MRALLLAIPLLAGPAGPGQEVLPGGVRVADERYPCQPADKVLRFFHLETDEPEMVKVNPALAELGAELAYGPRTTTGRPGHAFVAVRAPRAANVKKLEAALKKGGGAVEPLAALAFDGGTGKGHDFGLGGLGITKRDFVLGMSGDVVWYDTTGAWSQIFGKPGKLKPQDLLDRYEKLYAPYGGAKLGDVARERFSWTLASAPDDKLRAKVLKALEKVPGIEGAVIEGDKLTLTVALRNLEACGESGKLPEGEPLDEASKEAPRVVFDAGGVYELLRVEGLVK